MPDPANAPGDSSGLWLLLLLVLLLCCAFGAAAESAVANASESRLRQLAEAGDRRARRILERLEEPERLRAALHTGRSLSTLLAATLAAVWLEGLLLPPLLAAWPWLAARPTLGVLGLTVLLTLGIAYVLLVLGELVPGRIGLHHPEAVLQKTGGFWRCFAALFRAPTALLSGSARLIGRLFGIDPASRGDVVTEEDIRDLMDAGEETGVLEGSQKDMIENIFAFDDITADQIMTPRTDVEAVDISAPVSQALELGIREGYSRLPLYEGDVDHIVGVLYVKDLLAYVGRLLPEELTLRQLCRATYFVPGAKRCKALFAEMTEKHLQMAVVVDEYGGVAGIVTMEDLLESIVGNIQDEFDHEEEEVRRTGENSFEVDGSMDMEELCALWDVPPPEGGFDTVAGFILDELGRIPTPEEHVQITYHRLTLTVLSMEDRRIEKVQIQVAPPEEADATA